MTDRPTRTSNSISRDLRELRFFSAARTSAAAPRANMRRGRLLDYGFRVIIAPSFADIFYNNCFKNGILPIALTESQVEELFQRVRSDERFQLTVDLERQWITDDSALRLSFDVDPFRRECLLKGLDDIGMTLQHEEKIREYEKNTAGRLASV